MSVQVPQKQKSQQTGYIRQAEAFRCSPRQSFIRAGDPKLCSDRFLAMASLPLATGSFLKTLPHDERNISKTAPQHIR